MSIKRVFSNSGIYVLISFVQRGLNFLMLPVYTAFLTPTDYGTVGLILGIGGLLSAFYSLSLAGAGTLFTAEFKDNPEALSKLWGNLFLVVLANSLVWTLILGLFHTWTIDLSLPGVAFNPYIIIGLLLFLTNGIYSLWQAYLQAIQDAKSLGFNNALFFGVNLGLTVLLVVLFKKGTMGFLLAQALASAFFALYSVFRWWPSLSFTWDWPLIKRSLIYSLPLIPHNLSSWVGNTLDRLLLNGIVATAAVGVYNVAFQWASVLSILCFGVNQAYVPWYLERVRSEHYQSEIRRFSALILAIYFVFSLGLSAFAKEIISLITPSSYHQAWEVVPFLVLGNFALGLYLIFVAPLFEKNSKMVPLVSLSAAISSLALNYLLIPYWGIQGSSISYMASQTTMMLFTYVLARRERQIQYDWIWFGSLGLGLVLLQLGLHFFFFDLDLVWRIGSTLLIGTVVLLGAYAKGLLKR